jgi:hypothetical protein
MLVTEQVDPSKIIGMTTKASKAVAEKSTAEAKKHGGYYTRLNEAYMGNTSVNLMLLLTFFRLSRKR